MFNEARWSTSYSLFYKIYLKILNMLIFALNWKQFFSKYKIQFLKIQSCNSFILIFIYVELFVKRRLIWSRNDHNHSALLSIIQTQLLKSFTLTVVIENHNVVLHWTAMYKRTYIVFNSGLYFFLSFCYFIYCFTWNQRRGSNLKYNWNFSS